MFVYTGKIVVIVLPFFYKKMLIIFSIFYKKMFFMFFLFVFLFITRKYWSAFAVFFFLSQCYLIKIISGSQGQGKCYCIVFIHLSITDNDNTTILLFTIIENMTRRLSSEAIVSVRDQARI